MRDTPELLNTSETSKLREEVGAMLLASAQPSDKRIVGKDHQPASANYFDAASPDILIHGANWVDSSLTYQQVGSHYEYHLQANGTDKALFQTSADKAGLAEASTRLKEMVRQKTEYLKSTYHIDIVNAGQQESYENRDTGKTERVTTRSPNIRELIGLEESLKVSLKNGNSKESSQKVKFVFCASKVGVVEGGAAFTNFDQKGTRIFVEPLFSKLAYTTDKDSPPNLLSMATGYTHELSHVSMHFSHGPKTDDQLSDETISKLGFLRATFNGKPTWIVAGTDNNNYLSVLDASGNAGWLQMANRQLIPVSNDLVMSKCKVKPIEGYLSTPAEVMADGLAWFRSGEKRSYLASHSAQLYQMAKDLDQTEIDEQYGKNGNLSSFIRSPEGQIVPNSAANQHRVSEFEAKYLRSIMFKG